MGSVKKKMYQSHSKYIFRTLEIARLLLIDSYDFFYGISIGKLNFRTK